MLHDSPLDAATSHETSDKNSVSTSSHNSALETWKASLIRLENFAPSQLRDFQNAGNQRHSIVFVTRQLSAKNQRRTEGGSDWTKNSCVSTAQRHPVSAWTYSSRLQSFDFRIYFFRMYCVQLIKKMAVVGEAFSFLTNVPPEAKLNKKKQTRKW